jgi:hypothetical protein
MNHKYKGDKMPTPNTNQVSSGMTPEDFKAVVEALRAPTDEQVAAKKADIEQRREVGLAAKAEMERIEATKKICPHRQDIGQSDKSALCYVKQATPETSFIICQCCGLVIMPTNPNWREYILRCPR